MPGTLELIAYFVSPCILTALAQALTLLHQGCNCSRYRGQVRSSVSFAPWQVALQIGIEIKAKDAIKSEQQAHPCGWVAIVRPQRGPYYGQSTWHIQIILNLGQESLLPVIGFNRLICKDTFPIGLQKQLVGEPAQPFQGGLDRLQGTERT